MDAVVVWIAQGDGAAPSPAAAPNDEAARALDAWAHARGVKLVLPPADPPARSIDWGASAAVEGALEEARQAARDALTSLDFAGADRKLEDAAATLRAHPELPNAAWLLAEVERARSSRWLRAKDEGRARAAWQRASALDGSRAPGLGERAFEDAPQVTATIRLDGDPGDLTLRLDGAPIAPGEVKRGEGEHALVLVRSDGGVAWASWVVLTQGGVVRVPIPAPVPCGADDIKRVQLDGSQVAAPLVQCGRWVVAVTEAPAATAGLAPPAPSAIRVARCEAGSCGALEAWEAAPSTGAAAPLPAKAAAPATDAHPAHWPAWATWALIGVGVAGAAVGIAAGAGAFRSAPTETHFVNGGLQIRSF